MRQCFSTISLLALVAWLYPAALMAGPQDVQKQGYDPHAGPIGELSADEVLTMPPPKSPPAAPPPPPAPDIAVQQPDRIAISEPPPALERFGLYEAEQTGFPVRVWEYLTQAEAADLLKALHAPLPHDARGDAIRRLLLSNANPPREAEAGWLATRLRRMVALGLVVDAATLLEALPHSLREPSLHRLALFIRLLTNQTGPACAVFETMQQREQPPKGAPYERLRVYCAVRTGQPAQAELAITLRRERGDPFADWFVRLIESQQYDNVRLEAMPQEPGDLDLAMLFAAGTSQLPPELDMRPYHDSSYLPYHWLIGMAKGSDPATRALFLESVLRAGNGDVATLKQLYAKLAQSPPTHKPLAARAGAYQVLINARTDRAAANAMARALTVFAEHPVLRRSLLREPAIALSQSLNPTRAHLEMAPALFALLTEHGQHDAAGTWLNVLDRQAPDAVITYITHELARFARLRPAERSRAATQLPPLSVPEDADAASLRLLQRFYRVMPAFGYQVPDVSAAILKETIARFEKRLPTPNAGWDVEELQAYAQQGNVAGLLLHTAAEPASLAAIDDISLLSLIDGLHALGQRELARRIALQSMWQMIHATAP